MAGSWAGDGGDFDGDGRDDLALLRVDGPDQDRSRAHLILGWDLPWDDPDYW